MKTGRNNFRKAGNSEGEEGFLKKGWRTIKNPAFAGFFIEMRVCIISEAEVYRF